MAKENEVINEDTAQKQGFKKLTESQQYFLSHDNDDELISVSVALRRDFGAVKVKGTIMGMTKLFKVISKIKFYCDKCKKLTEREFPFPLFTISELDKEDKKCDKCKSNISSNKINLEYRNVVIIELQDNDAFNEMDKISVFLFDDNTQNVIIGENIKIVGDIKINETKRKLFTYIYADTIQYLNREDFKLTDSDIKAIKKFVKINHDKIIDKLVWMFDPSIVGYDYVKKGLLMSAANTSYERDNVYNILSKIKQKNNKNKINSTIKNERLNCLLIGNPGLAKSKLLKRITELVPRSSYESAQKSSGKSLTAIIDKSDENTFLRLGPIPRAKGAICGLNEFGRQNFEDQGHILDVMEEGEFSGNKHGINFRIFSPTTIIATANPINNSQWIDSDGIDVNEFPVLGPILDRFDFKFVFRKLPPEDEDFTDKLTKIHDLEDKGLLPDYTLFLIKYIQFARQLNPILNDESYFMLTQFYKEINKHNFGSPRILKTLFKVAKAIARLKLKEIVDTEDAKEVMEFYSIMLSDFQINASISKSPRDIWYNACVSILREGKEFGILLEELFRKAYERNLHIKSYFGINESLKIESNWKCRTIYEMLLNNPNIVRINDKPIVLQWREKRSSFDYVTYTIKPSSPLSEVSEEYDEHLDNEKFKDDFHDGLIIENNYKDNINNHINSNLISSNKRNLNNFSINGNYASYTSDASGDNESSAKSSFKCYYCPSEFSEEQKYKKHCFKRHPGQPLEPQLSLIKQMNLEPKGNLWEI